MKSLYTILLLAMANVFMTLAWYGHLRLNDVTTLQKWGLSGLILFSWGIAFFEYCLQVPANKIGYDGNGGPFSLFQLKIIQEIITLSVFVLFALLFFKTETFTKNYMISFICIIAAVYFAFKK
ncbi:MAG: DMT family protein [Saprospiraceae bacterium]|nr:DMT family protein [Candidatus Vicinibacter affinis]MBK7799748.1 DMT family protein [Candidatus Vicinibacter affinis]MBK9961363.1 DMT family protein [Candidatus Vicinibacter affinis]MBP6172668.1 DMT family protein [Saprospiraceae bacterium]MBP6521918.1 DMT family protein [Saprospiraceae bacterium]